MGFQLHESFDVCFSFWLFTLRRNCQEAKTNRPLVTCTRSYPLLSVSLLANHVSHTELVQYFVPLG